MSTAPKSSSANTIVGILLGAALMVGGMWVSQNWKPEFLHALEEQGIPLDLGKTVAVVGVFLILFPVIRSFFVAPLATAINERTTELERTFSEAENLRHEMTQMKSDYEQRLATTEAAARETIQAQIKEAQALRQQIMAEATAKADELKQQAIADIEQEKSKVITELRLEAVNLTMMATERILGENIDQDRNRKLVQDFIDKAEVLR